jgi:hypothetical protein
MADWIAPPAQVTWAFDPPLVANAQTYPQATLHAPCGADVLKATAIQGSSGLEVTARLCAILSVEGVPFEAMITAPSWQLEQMSNYVDSFNSAPLPGPLEDYRKAVADAARAALVSQQASLSPAAD